MTSKPHFAPRLGLLLGVAVLITLPAVAAAQTTTQVDSVRVSLWPEYDRSDVLVIYRVELPAAAQLPAQIRLLIPPDSPELTAAAYRDASGQLVNAAATRTDGEAADVVEVAADGTELQIEFYLPLAITGDQRRFDFVWPGGLAADDFAYEIQQPLGATGMAVNPAATSRSTDSRGLTYHLVDLGAQTAEGRPEVTFSYTKSTPALSSEALGPAGGLATPSPAAGMVVDVRGLLPWILLGAGVALIAGGVVYFLRNRSVERAPRPRHRASRPQPAQDENVDASPVYCHNCGTQATASDRFCRQCGTPLRV